MSETQMPLVGRKLVFLGQNKRTRRSESRNVRVRTLTQHAQEGSMAARCFWRGIDAPLASEHITEKVACRDLVLFTKVRSNLERTKFHIFSSSFKTASRLG